MTPRSQRSETTDLGRLKPVVELESTTAPAALPTSVSCAVNGIPALRGFPDPAFWQAVRPGMDNFLCVPVH